MFLVGIQGEGGTEKVLKDLLNGDARKEMGPESKSRSGSTLKIISEAEVMSLSHLSWIFRALDRLSREVAFHVYGYDWFEMVRWFSTYTFSPCACMIVKLMSA